MTYVGPLVDTLFIDGTDIQSIDGLYVADFSALHAEGEYRGDPLVLPGRPGQKGYLKKRDAFVMDFPVQLVGDTRAEFLAILAAVRALCPTNLTPLTRRLTSTVDPFYVDDDCLGEYQAGQAVELLNPATGRTTLSFLNLSGGWA
jgi:hypothetical protein